MAGPVYVVIPAYNEGAVIGRVIGHIKRQRDDAVVIVVNDGSTDNTAEEALRAGGYVITLPFNCGYGVALQTGLVCAYRAGASIAVTMDADGQHEPDDIKRLTGPVLGGSADIALGSRYLPESVSYRVPAMRRLASACVAKLLSLLCGQHFTDSTSGFQCLNRKALELLTTLKDFPERAPDADLILLLVKRGCRVREVAVTMHADQGGESMHGPLKSLFYLPNMCTSMLSVLLGYAVFRK